MTWLTRNEIEALASARAVACDLPRGEAFEMIAVALGERRTE